MNSERGYDANENGMCVVCAVEFGLSVKATHKTIGKSQSIGICNLHAKMLRSEQLRYPNGFSEEASRERTDE